MDARTRHDLMLSQLVSLSSQLDTLRDTLKIKSVAYEENVEAIDRIIKSLSSTKTLQTKAFGEF